MYVRITRGRFQPERIDNVEALSSHIAEAIKILPGFLGYQGGVDRNDHGLIVRPHSNSTTGSAPSTIRRILKRHRIPRHWSGTSPGMLDF